MENFQFFFESSSRSRNRFFCSSFEMCKKNFRITTPFPVKYSLDVFFAFDAGRGGGVPILQSKLLALGDAKGFCEARGLFDKLVLFHGFGSVVQTWRSEQRAESPSEGGEAVVGVEEGIF